MQVSQQHIRQLCDLANLELVTNFIGLFVLVAQVNRNDMVDVEGKSLGK